MELGIFEINAQILWGLYALSVLVALIFSYILLFHWKIYGQGDKKVARGKILYILGLVVLLLAPIFILIQLE